MPFQSPGTTTLDHPFLGWCQPDAIPCSRSGAELADALRRLNQPLFIAAHNDSLIPLSRPRLLADGETPPPGALPLVGFAPPCPPENLGDPSFCRELGIRYPYLGGSMAKGISSVAMALALGRAGMLGFFGAAGQTVPQVEEAVNQLISGGVPFGCNLIHSPHDPELEQALVRLYLDRRVRLVEASAFMKLTLPLVRYRLTGIRRNDDGTIHTPNRIIAKVSREELAARFFAPPPDEFLRELVASGEITHEQAELANRIPMAQEITAEADSGGHTDNRPANALFPTIASLASRMQAEHGYDLRLRVGLGGGVSTPAAAAAAFVMGAAYVMTGSVNQACRESGTSDEVRAMLAETRQADVTMAPSADMFEMGVNVQVLKRGTMFPMRAQKLYEIYRAWPSLEQIPTLEREKLEKTIFQAPLEQIWKITRDYFLKRAPQQVTRAEQDPKHRMALVFRWYLGQAAHWAKDGDRSRRIDYQIWCGPAMGAFNEWVAGSFLEPPANRDVVTVGLNILFGAALMTRVSALRCQGLPIPREALTTKPLELAHIKEYLSGENARS
jgi:PfaD family protein